MGGILLLEDGRQFLGEAFGATTTRVGESVFNTAMTGYQEILTDPSYTEQVVCMTVPHVGNTGVNEEDPESRRVHAAGFVVRALTRAPSSWRSQGGLHQYLVKHGIPGLQGIDTRALVRHLRSRGAMKCAISTDGATIEALHKRIADWPGMDNRALAAEVACREPYVYHEPAQPSLRFGVVDGGIKSNILRSLKEAGCYVRVHPITDTAAQWSKDVDAVLVGNGPGDPAALTHAIAELRTLVGRVPLVGICLGHQLLALALGASTYKLKFGHRGANQPVRDELTGRVEITSQNHGFAVDRQSLLATGAIVSHTHLNDDTISGLIHREKRVYAVQYHPESCPGPHDSRSILVEQFVRFVKTGDPVLAALSTASAGLS